jgi:hypothetical protein
MDFYGIVLTVAAILFILLLTLMGVLISRSPSTIIYPPTSNTCPDYWAVDAATGQCTFPTTGSNGIARNQGFYPNDSYTKFNSDPKANMKAPFATVTGTTWTFNPNDTKWSANGKSSLCSQRDWAVNHNIVWDGVSNYNGC